MEDKKAYHGEFDNWADVQSQFSMTNPEPDCVIFAEYENGGYDGTAHVVYRDKDKYYYVYGSHCSCNGLEGQFEPEKYDTLELFRAVVGRWSDSEMKSTVRQALADDEREAARFHAGAVIPKSRRMVDVDED